MRVFNASTHLCTSTMYMDDICVCMCVCVCVYCAGNVCVCVCVLCVCVREKKRRLGTLVCRRLHSTCVVLQEMGARSTCARPPLLWSRPHKCSWALDLLAQQTHKHKYTHTHTHTYTHKHAQTRTNAIHTDTHTHTQTIYARAHTHTHNMHVYTWARGLVLTRKKTSQECVWHTYYPSKPFLLNPEP